MSASTPVIDTNMQIKASRLLVSCLAEQNAGIARSYFHWLRCPSNYSSMPRRQSCSVIVGTQSGDRARLGARRNIAVRIKANS